VVPAGVSCGRSTLLFLQAGHEISTGSLFANQDSAAIADFRWSGEADITPGVAEEVHDSAISVTVTNPQTMGGTLRSYTVYTVTLSTSLTQFPKRDTEVLRRYSEFEWLHHRISRTFPSAIIPLFPSKKAVGSMDSTFVHDRMRQLEAYLVGVCHHPRVSQSYDLIVFLTGTPASLAAARDYTAYAESQADEADSFYNALITSTKPPLVVKTDEDYERLSAFHSEALERLRTVSTISQRLHEGMHAADEHLLELGHAIASLAEAEQQGIAAGASVVASRASDEAQHQALKSLATSSPTPKASFSTSTDTHAAAAFEAHSRAGGTKGSGISSMFATDFDDPLAGMGDPMASGFQKPASSAPAPGSDETPAARLAALYRLVGETTVRLSHMSRDHLDRADTAFHLVIREELRREAELDQAAQRREVRTWVCSDGACSMCFVRAGSGGGVAAGARADAASSRGVSGARRSRHRPCARRSCQARCGAFRKG
jgi:hypothetical protein